MNSNVVTNTQTAFLGVIYILMLAGETFERLWKNNYFCHTQDWKICSNKQ